MDTAGLVECLQVSEKDGKLRYINYLGDGYSKSFFRNIKTEYISTKTSKKLKCIVTLKND